MEAKKVEEGSVVIDGVDHPLSEMNERQLYLVAQLQEIQTEKKRAIAVLDRLNVTESGFTSLLKETLADFSKLKKLKVLGLSDMGITSASCFQGIQALEDLEDLRISKNKVGDGPAASALRENT